MKDLDVWAFFARNPVRPFPYRRRGCVDFGPSPLGRHPDDKGYEGRRVDVIGRDIQVAKGHNPLDATQHYVSEGRTESAGFLKMRPVIMLHPKQVLGNVIWDPKSRSR